MEITQENEQGKQVTQEKTEVKPITKDTTFAEVMEQHPEAREELFSMGLGCGGCPMAQMESIEGGAFVHGIDPDSLVNELNKKFVDKNTEQKTQEEKKLNDENHKDE